MTTLDSTYTNKAERLDGLCAVIERLRSTVSLPMPDADMVREAIDGILNTRTGKLLRSAPNIDARPLANVFWYINDWHRGSGYIGTIYNNRFKCGYIAKARNLDITGSELHDMLDTLALVLRKGDSPASDRWTKALGR